MDCCKDEVDIYIGKTTKYDVLQKLFGWSELQTKMIMEKLISKQFVKSINKNDLSRYTTVLATEGISFEVKAKRLLK